MFSLPGFCQEEDELLVEELQAQRTRQIEAAKKLNQAKENLEKPAFDPMGELQKLGYKEINLKTLTDAKALEVVKKMMDQRNLQSASPENVRKALFDKVSPGTQEFLNEHPKITDAIVDVLRDEKALSSLIGILLRKDDLKRYAMIWFCLIVLSWLFKKIFYGPKWKTGKRMIVSLMLSLTVTTVSLLTFYQLFKSELSPIVRIAGHHWNKD